MKEFSGTFLSFTIAYTRGNRLREKRYQVGVT